MRAFIRLMGIATLALVGGCAAQPPGAASAEGAWKLVQLGDLHLHAGIEAPTLVVAGDEVSGFAGVNRYTGRLADEGEFLFGPLASTRMAGPPAAMELETRYLSALQQATGWRVEEGQLRVVSGDDLVAVFEPATAD